MNIEILLGYEENQLDDLATSLNSNVNFKFESRDSSYLGEYYYLQNTEGQIKLRHNVDPLWVVGDSAKDKFAFPEHANYPIIITIDGSEKWVTTITDKLLAAKPNIIKLIAPNKALNQDVANATPIS